MIKEELREIKEEVVGCRKCSLYKSRILPVVGQGNHRAKIVFVGEAPGATEDRTGIPFCGQAGNILDELLSSVKIKREEVYICNILKCRPPGNRDPLPKEIESCTPYLEKQIDVINPKVIAALGNYASSFILKKYGLEDEVEGISRIHGKVFQAGRIEIIPLYHPAVAVYNRNAIKSLKKDFRILKKEID